jgi:hypothetical protein
VVFSGEELFRDSYSEHILTGKKLPLAEEDALLFLDRWKNFFKGISTSAFLVRRYIGFLHEAAQNFME